MEIDGGPYRSCDGTGRGLARLRKRASGFFESLSVAELAQGAHRQRWIADWLGIAEGYRTRARSARENGLAQNAQEAWLCALTSLEVVRNLSCPGDSGSLDLAGNVGSGLAGLEKDAGPAIERVTIGSSDDGVLTGLYLPAFHRDAAAPVVVCVSDRESLGSMASRLLSASYRGGVSLLLVDAGDPSSRPSGSPEYILQCWLDYLVMRADADPQRIAIYGEGVGAIHASRLALSDRRIAAAVCDGGVLTPIIRRASWHWTIGQGEGATDGASTGSSLPSRRIPCPLLVVVGSRSMMREEDALALQASYRQVGADCAVVVPNRIPHPLGEVENFAAVDDFIFEWLGSKLGAARRFDSVTYL